MGPRTIIMSSAIVARSAPTMKPGETKEVVNFTMADSDLG
jgi:hypothetical protein